MIKIYTDGACSGNPGPGGYAFVMKDEDTRYEFSQGFRLTTNNRMEIMAVSSGIARLKFGQKAVVFSDSRYVIDSLNMGWASKWREHNWMRNDKDKANNVDLWEDLLDMLKCLVVKFEWIHGHNGNVENERADYLSKLALKNPIQIDYEYEKSRVV